MFKTQLKIAILLFVSSAGLFSCAKEKTVQDNFSIGAPAVVDERGVFKDAPQLASMQFTPQSILQFPELEGRDLVAEGIVIHTVTNCGENVSEDISKFEFRNVSAIRIQDLLPLDSLIQRSGAEEVKVCTISVYAKNRHGSRHEYTVPSLKVTLSPHMQDLDYATQGFNTQDQGEQPASHFAELMNELKFDTDLKNPERVHLLCKNFRSEAKLGDVKLEGTRVFLQRRLNYANQPLEDIRKHPRQSCRFAIESTGDKHETRVSSYFNLQFETPKPVVESDSSNIFNRSDYKDMRDVRLYFQTYKISNPFDFPVSFAVEKKVAESLLLRTHRSYIVRKQTSATLDWTVTGGTQRHDGNLIFVTLAAKESAELTATMIANDLLQPQNGMRVSLNDLYHISGFFYGPGPNQPSIILPSDVEFSPNDFSNPIRLNLLDMTQSNPSRILPLWSPLKLSSQLGPPGHMRGPRVITEPTSNLVFE